MKRNGRLWVWVPSRAMLLPFATEAELPAAAPAAVELDPKMTVVELVLVELDP